MLFCGNQIPSDYRVCRKILGNIRKILKSLFDLVAIITIPLSFMVLAFFFFFFLILVRHLLAALMNILLTWSTAESMSPVSNLLFKLSFNGMKMY